MKFDFVAKDLEGQIKSGIIDSPNKELAITDLQNAGLVIINVIPRAALPKFAFGKVSDKNLAFFTRELATLINARVPITDTLRSLYRQTEDFLLKDALFESIKDVDGGLSLSQAFSRHKRIFSNYYIQILEISELTGTLDESLNYLADYLEKESNLTNRARNALTYPAIVTVVFVVVVLVLFTWLIPKINQFFTQARVELPLITQIFISISDFIINWWYLILLIFGLFSYLVFLYLQTNEGKTFFDDFYLSLPYFGELFKKIYLTRFAETVSTLLKGGIPLGQSLEISGQVIGNKSYELVLLYSSEVVRRGGKISELLQRYPRLFSPVVVQMVETGEKTGKLGELLDKSANYYEQEIDRALNNLVDVIEPILIIILGAGVGLLEVSIFLPIYTLINTIGTSGL